MRDDPKPKSDPKVTTHKIKKTTAKSDTTLTQKLTKSDPKVTPKIKKATPQSQTNDSPNTVRVWVFFAKTA